METLDRLWPALEALSARLGELAPKLFLAGVVDGAVVRHGKNLGLDEAVLLGRAARLVALVFVVLIALEQLDIGAKLVRYSFLIILAGLVLALALAFGRRADMGSGSA
jgi:hypothetical protein